MTSAPLNRYGFRACLRDRGWSQKRLAAEIGVSPRYISRLASGKVAPRDDMFDRLVDALQVGDPKMLLEDWELLQPLPEGVDHVYRHEDIIVQVCYDRSPENVYYWRRSLQLLALLDAARHQKTAPAQDAEDSCDG